jgi:Tol biopolymer transport system component
MSRTPASILRATAVLVCLAALAAGCGVVGNQSGTRVGDVAGEHLVAFATDRAGTMGGTDVALYDLDNGGFRSVSNLNGPAAETEPAISEDGTLVAFGSNRTGGAGGWDLYVYGRATEGLLSVPGLNTAADETHPRFAYDNRYLAFVRDSSGFKRIRLYDPVGDSLVALRNMTTPGAWDDDEPAPDLHADRIAFTSTRTGAKHVYVWNRLGGLASPSALLADSLDAEPSLSGNGRWLAFASNRTGGAGSWDLYLYDLTNGAFVRLPRLNTAGEERHPSVSASGTTIAFQARATSSGTWDLWTWSMSDSTLRQPTGLSAAGANDLQPFLRWR